MSGTLNKVGAGTLAEIEADGRSAARQRRAELCQNGRGDAPACRPTGRVRPKVGDIPANVAPRIDSTFDGTTMTDTRRTPNRPVINHAANTSHISTGAKNTRDDARYITSLQESLAGNKKMSIQTTTPSGNGRITGLQCSDVGAARLTINGSKKVALAQTPARQSFSDGDTRHTVKITGDEAGSSRAISGSTYISNEYFPAVRNDHTNATAAPSKVGTEATQHRIRIITGTLMNYGEPTTATDAVQSVSDTAGTSLGDDELPVTGTKISRSAKVTGNELGSTLMITGTAYARRPEMPFANTIGNDTFDTKTAPMEIRNPLMARRGQSYQTPDDRQILYPQATTQAEPSTKEASKETFSIVSPARKAQGVRERITGTSYDGGSRITGPVNMAAGLISGTPEFRYRSDQTVTTIPARQPLAEPTQPTPPNVSRITGAGSEAGSRITGDDWARGGLVTGTEGRWAHGRNLTLRGEPRSMNAGARANKENDRADVSPSNVSGSNGNSASLITVSGGARG